MEEGRVTTREVEHGSDGYREAVELRRRILRNPLGLDFDEEELAAEDAERHLVAFDGKGRVVGCLVLMEPEPDGRSVRMRQVAVEPAWRGRGIGRDLVRYSERLAVAEGIREMALHAREVALAFYDRLGYEVVGDAFLEVGIKHWKMRKRLG